MLGYHALRERQLRKSGRPALATVLESKRTHWLQGGGDPSLVANTQIVWKLVLRVEPDGESPFEAKLDEPFPQTWSPGPGARFPVLYDPDDHSKVVIDHSEEATKGLARRMSEERADGMLSRMRARGQSDIADRYQAMRDAGLLGNEGLSSDPDERRRQLEERRAQIKEMMGGQGVIIGGQPVYGGGAGGGVAATADALTKLADLRDRGVLSDAEFQAQKQKLLGQ